MSDAQPGPGWWVAPDGRWYPPDQHPGPAPAARTDATVGPGRRTLTVLIVAVVLLVGAGAVLLVAQPGAPGPGSTALPTGAGPARSGCGTDNASPGDTFSEGTEDQGRQRTALVHVPVHYRDTVPTPLVVNLHGSGSDGASEESYTGMDATADAATFFVVYPTAAIPDGSGFDWNVPGDPVPGSVRGPDDVRYLVDLVGNLEQMFCINPHRVYVTGFSRGARMTDVVACQASATFAAVAPVSGVRLPSPCPTTRPVPLLTIHGTFDLTDPYQGHGQHHWTYSVPTAVALWGAHDGCTGPRARALPGVDTVVSDYARCPAGVSVELYTVVGSGHEWPGSVYNAEPPTAQVLQANDVIWAFFAAHPMT